MIESKSLLATMKQLVDALENHSAIKHPQQIQYRDEAIQAGKQAIKELEKKKPVAEDGYCFGDERYYAND